MASKKWEDLNTGQKVRVIGFLLAVLGLIVWYSIYTSNEGDKAMRDYEKAGQEAVKDTGMIFFGNKEYRHWKKHQR